MAEWLIFALPFLLLANDSEANTMCLEAQHIQGKWVVQSLEVSGNKVSDEDIKKSAMKYVFNKDTVTIEINGKRDSQLKVSLDPSIHPNVIDLTGVEGVEKGESARGIYKIEGDTLTLCFELGEGSRPGEFCGGEMRMLLVLKREKSK